jgi:hypothetical protein
MIEELVFELLREVWDRCSYKEQSAAVVRISEGYLNEKK